MRIDNELVTKLNSLSFHELDAREYVRQLCKIGIELFSVQCKDFENFSDFHGRLCGLLAEGLGINPDCNLREEDFWDILVALKVGNSLEDIAKTFVLVPVIRVERIQ
jgi:hypothetical protein